MNRLEFASSLAADAGRLAHSAFGQSAVSSKGRHDLVTEMDGEVERFIRAAIAKRYPDDAIIGEEQGGHGGIARVDPRSDRRHRELRARHPALLRVDRLSRGRRADRRRALRPEPRLAVRRRARRRCDAQRRAACRQPVRRHVGRDRRMRLVDAAHRRRTTSRWCSA